MQRVVRRLARGADHDGHVLPLDVVPREERLERLPRRLVLGDHQEPARALVQPVDDAGPQVPCRIARIGARALEAAAREERVDQRPLSWPRAGWTTRPAGLSTTRRWASSKTTVSWMDASGSAVVAGGGSGETSMRAPAETGVEARAGGGRGGRGRAGSSAAPSSGRRRDRRARGGRRRACRGDREGRWGARGRGAGSSARVRRQTRSRDLTVASIGPTP